MANPGEDRGTGGRLAAYREGGVAELRSLIDELTNTTGGALMPIHSTHEAPPTDSPAVAASRVAPVLERRGRAWLLWSFLLCPCHLPLSLGVLATVLAGTSAGLVLRDHVWVAATLITVLWVIGTGYGFRLVRQAERANASCPVRTP